MLNNPFLLETFLANFSIHQCSLNSHFVLLSIVYNFFHAMTIELSSWNRNPYCIQSLTYLGLDFCCKVFPLYGHSTAYVPIILQKDI